MAAKLASISPVLPVRNVRRALEHYRQLGFNAKAYNENVGDDAVYGFIDRDGIELHLSRFAELNIEENTSACYLYVDDAEALYAEWKAANPGGRFSEPEDTPYQLREFAYWDPDGNLLRVGSQLRSSQ
jgi:hypothetical protein